MTNILATNLAVAIGIQKILESARRGRVDEFFAAMNIITGKDIIPKTALFQDIFSEYESAVFGSSVDSQSSKIRKLIDGFRLLYSYNSSNDSLEEGVENIVEGLDRIGIENLINLLEIFCYSKNKKSSPAIKNLVLTLENIKEIQPMLSPQMIKQILSNRSFNLSCIDQFLLRLKKYEPKLKEGFIEKIGISQEEGRKLLFAATIDHLIFQYMAFIYMNNSDMCHDFFLGICDFVMPIERRDIDFDHLDKKRFDILMDKYEFRNEDKERVSKIIQSFAKIAVPRFFFFNINKNLVCGKNGLLEAISNERFITITQKNIDKLALYDIASPDDIKKLEYISQERPKLSMGEELDMLDNSAYFIMTKYLPKMCMVPCAGQIPQMFKFMNFVSRMNELAHTYCSEPNGKIAVDEAAAFLLRYLNEKNYPSKDEDILALVSKRY